MQIEVNGNKTIHISKEVSGNLLVIEDN